MSITEVNAGQWVRCADLGWPLNLLGSEAEVWVDPLPSEVYKKAIAKASKEVRYPTDSPHFYAALEKALPWIYAAAVMTKMRGIRLVPAGEILEDTETNRRTVLTLCPLLAERIYRFATRGPEGIAEIGWRDVAVRHRTAIREVHGLLATASQGTDPSEILEAVRSVVDGVEIVGG